MSFLLNSARSSLSKQNVNTEEKEGYWTVCDTANLADCEGLFGAIKWVAVLKNTQKNNMFFRIDSYTFPDRFVTFNPEMKQAPYLKMGEVFAPEQCILVLKQFIYNDPEEEKRQQKIDEEEDRYFEECLEDGVYPDHDKFKRKRFVRLIYIPEVDKRIAAAKNAVARGTSEEVR